MVCASHECLSLDKLILCRKRNLNPHCPKQGATAFSVAVLEGLRLSSPDFFFQVASSFTGSTTPSNLSLFYPCAQQSWGLVSLTSSETLSTCLSLAHHWVLPKASPLSRLWVLPENDVGVWWEGWWLSEQKKKKKALHYS